MRIAIIAACFMAAGGCGAIERAQLAKDAKQSLVGMSDERILACMGPPRSRAAAGGLEVWQYQSGNGQIDIERDVNGAVATQRHCLINISMRERQVQSVSYSGPTGGLLSAGEQCAFALQGCFQKP